MPAAQASPRFFAVTTPGLSATRWLTYVLASHPDVFAAHGKFALDSVVGGDFRREKESASSASLTLGNALRQFYETRSLEEVFAAYQGIKPGARAFGCVHSYTIHTLVQAARSADTLAGLRIQNVVRHPVELITSHYGLVLAAEKHPLLDRYYQDEVFPQTLQQFPELYLLPCPDFRAFLAFAVSCRAVNNLLLDMCYPGIRHWKMETLTTQATALREFCEDLTGLSYASATLEAFIRRGAMNRHRTDASNSNPHSTYAAWTAWQQDMAHLMISGPVLDWLEEIGYDLAMFREQAAPVGGDASAPPRPACLADCLRSLDPRHPLLAHLSPSGPNWIQAIESNSQGFRLAPVRGKVAAVARSLKLQDVSDIDDDVLTDLEESGLCFQGASAAEVWRAICGYVAKGAQGAQVFRGEERSNMPNPELVMSRRKPGCKLSIILLDWGVRESFHSLHYLNQQTVPRAQYELIWLEFYRRKPLKLQDMLFRRGKNAPLLDQWLVAGYADDIIFNKHRLYNLGLLAAQGEYCVFCDSDAIFTPNFVAKLLDGFAQTPRAVLHLDEIRNQDPRFHPFAYPSIEEVLGPGCINWNGNVSRGLDDSPDILHDANYGACMAASRADLLAIGGADEHLDYLGYVCGPYDMTFRLVNHGLTERWLRDEYLYHVWHPNVGEKNGDYQGPHDGRLMSSRALESRCIGRVQPCLENPWVAEARQGKHFDLAELVRHLGQRDEPTWLAGCQPDTEDAVFMVEANYHGFNLFRYRQQWYALRIQDGYFEPARARHYRVLIRHENIACVKHLVGYYNGLPPTVWGRLWRQPVHHWPARIARKVARELSRLF